MQAVGTGWGNGDRPPADSASDDRKVNRWGKLRRRREEDLIVSTATTSLLAEVEIEVGKFLSGNA